MARKLILTGALVLFNEESVAQLLLGAIVCIFYYVLLANWRPFEEEKDDYLSQLTSIQLLLTLLAGLVLKAQVAPSSLEGAYERAAVTASSRPHAASAAASAAEVRSATCRQTRAMG